MKRAFKYGILLIVFLSFGAIIYGFTLKSETEQLANRFIGFGTVGLFFVAMPLFLIKESKGKKMKDYMLTNENIKKMNDRESKNLENR